MGQRQQQLDHLRARLLDHRRAKCNAVRLRVPARPCAILRPHRTTTASSATRRAPPRPPPCSCALRSRRRLSGLLIRRRVVRPPLRRVRHSTHLGRTRRSPPRDCVRRAFRAGVVMCVGRLRWLRVGHRTRARPRAHSCPHTAPPIRHAGWARRLSRASSTRGELRKSGAPRHIGRISGDMPRPWDRTVKQGAGGRT